MAKIDKNPQKQKAQAGKVKKPVAQQREKADTSFMANLRRDVEFAKKNALPKGGGLEPTLDKPFWDYLSSGGPLGIRGRGAKGEAGSRQITPDKKNDLPDWATAKRPAKPTNLNKNTIRKSQTKLTIKKVSKNITKK
jgi:hypothetical protein